MKINKWYALRNFINSHEFLTRKDLKDEKLLDGSTTDNYVRFLTKCGFLKKIGMAEYQRILIIPDELSSSILLIIAYDEVKKIQFFRREKLKKINLTIK